MIECKSLNNSFRYTNMKCPKLLDAAVGGVVEDDDEELGVDSSGTSAAVARRPLAEPPNLTCLTGKSIGCRPSSCSAATV